MLDFDQHNHFLEFWKPPNQSVIFGTQNAPVNEGVVKVYLPPETLTKPTFYTWDSIRFFASVIANRELNKTEISELIHTNPKDREIYLPFIYNRAIHNYLSEQYLLGESNHKTVSTARSIYYALKPWLPRPIQLAFRRQAIARMSNRNFPAWPVDSSVEDLNWSLARQVLSLAPHHALPIISFWPRGAKSCLVITHDVELQTGFDQIEMILSMEQKFGVRSAWNIIPERYQVDRKVLQKLQAEGFEVGVHGLKHDGRLFESYQTFRSRAERINYYLHEWGCVGFRSPSNLRNLDWISEHLTLEYDSSCLSTELYGAQPGGSCTVFPFFHGNLVELPITLQQDFTLLDILQLSPELALENWLQSIQRIEAYNGMVLINVHPDYIVTPERISFYERFLSIMTNETTRWNALPCEIARWWRDRQASELVQTASGWRIEGPASELGIAMQVVSKENNLVICPYLSTDYSCAPQR